MKIALFTKEHKPTVKEVTEYLKKHFKEIAIFKGKGGDPFPTEAFEVSSDILISYLSPWILPGKILDRTKFWNINFHPGPPEYPGIGCFNFAIYNSEKFYGVTTHLMDKKVDTGKIIAIKKFPLLKSDSVYSLSIKSYEHMLILFFEVMDLILAKNILPNCNEFWKRKPYTCRELEELCRIDSHMTKQEVKKRIKASTYPNMPGGYIKIYDYIFEYNPERWRSNKNGQSLYYSRSRR